MGFTQRILLLLGVCNIVVLGFTVLDRPRNTICSNNNNIIINNQWTKSCQSHLIRQASAIPEYTEIDENDARFFTGVSIDETNNDSNEAGSKRAKRHFGAMAPGTVVRVQVGDLGMARKAWKKRRRSGSPLLVPCSVLGVDRHSMVRWNLIHLLEKFGQSQRGGIKLTTNDMMKHYRGFLGYSLSKLVDNLGYASVEDMLNTIFDKKVQENYGVKLVNEQRDGYTEYSLQAPISRLTGHKRAARTPLLLFRDREEDEIEDDADTFAHIGFVRVRAPEDSERRYRLPPLSAALRVSQKDDIDTGRVEEGSIHSAVVLDFESCGDGGLPLLTLSLNPGGLREVLKVKPERKYMPIENPRAMLEELSVGDGPFKATVTRLFAGKAIVDCRIGRRAGSSTVNVLGTLRYQDSIVPKKVFSKPPPIVDVVEDNDDDDDDDDNDETEDIIESALSVDMLDDEEEEVDDEEEEFGDDFEFEDEDDYDNDEEEELDFEDELEDEDDEDEISEDITHLFEMTEDGSLTFADPGTGEKIVVGDNDDNDKTIMEKLNTDVNKPGKRRKNDFARPFDKEGTSDIVIGKTKPRKRNSRNSMFKSKRLRLGEKVDVYIRTVSKQSNLYTVTTNPLIKGQKAKDVKKDEVTKKKLSRLQRQVGGDLDRLSELIGYECDGVVKATSKTGDWLYVQPNMVGLPVGIATLEICSEEGAFANGDLVRVRLAGIDENRGQLSMQVLGRREG